MHKLVILIHSLGQDAAFDELWPQFLHFAERMPGLHREVSCRVDHMLYGDLPVTFVHELYFDTLSSAQAAMASPEGRAAGRLLQEITAGRMTLFFAEHKEDDIENLRRYRKEDPPTE